MENPNSRAKEAQKIDEVKGGTFVKRKRYSAVLGCILTLALLIGIVLPIANAATVTIEFLNPLGTIVPPANQPLANRPGDLNGKTINLIYYGAATTPSALTLTALGELLREDYPSLTIKSTAYSGTMYDAKDAATYNSWASGTDAVIFGVVEDNVGAWWISYHAKELEARGVPVVVVANEWWEPAVQCGAEDNGIAALRTASINRAAYADAYGMATTGTPSARATYLKNQMKPLGVYDIVKSALTDPLTDLEKSTAPLDPKAFGDPGDATFAVTGQTYESAMQKFQDLSMQMDFGDGLPLDIPTQSAVSALLATTDRAPDEIIGRIMLRGGLITVEKVAVNAAMAGARPEHFPVILAAMEAYATAWEDNKLFYQATMANEQAILMMVISGPAVDELDVGNGRAFDPGSEGEGVLGRAIKLCVRNIGHVLQRNSTIINALYRINDHELYVVGESNEFLPAGWKTHSEMLGFPAGSNSVTLIATTRSQLTTGVGGGTATATAFLASMRTSLNTAATANAPGIYAINWTQANMASRPSGVNGGMGLTTKEQVQAYIANNVNRNNLVWPIVCGFGRSMGGRAFHGTATYNTRGFQAQYVAEIGDVIAPSAPLNFLVKVDYDSGKAALSWAAPARGDVDFYQVSKDGGATWDDVNATSYTYEGLNDGQRYFFAVRAVNDDIVNSVDIVQNGSTWDVSYAASGRGSWAYKAINMLPPVVNITGPADVTYLPGATATYTVSIERIPDVTAVELTLKVDGSFFDTKTSTGLNGFANVGNIDWKNIGGDIWEGTIVLAGDGSGDFDIFQIEFNLKGLLGATAVELVDFKIAFEGKWADFEYGDTIAATNINQWFSPYDLNSDGVIDLRDISIAMMYYMAGVGDANWTQASIADVNEDGVVDIEDLILIRANFT